MATEITTTILSSPTNIASLPQSKKPDAVFHNFVDYAKKNWTYGASGGKAGGQNLLDGTSKQAPCGGLATALKIVFIAAGIPDNDLQMIVASGTYVWTDPTYKCFDRAVTGNVCKLEHNTSDYAHGCIFKEHWYLKYGDRFYDPTLQAIYEKQDESIKQKLSNPILIGTGANGLRTLLVTDDKKTCLYSNPGAVPGFNAHWVMFDATKTNLKKAIGEEYKKEKERKGGDNDFAKYLNTLPNESMFDKLKSQIKK